MRDIAWAHKDLGLIGSFDFTWAARVPAQVCIPWRFWPAKPSCSLPLLRQIAFLDGDQLHINWSIHMLCQHGDHFLVLERCDKAFGARCLAKLPKKKLDD